MAIAPFRPLRPCAVLSPFRPPSCHTHIELVAADHSKRQMAAETAGLETASSMSSPSQQSRAQQVNLYRQTRLFPKLILLKGEISTTIDQLLVILISDMLWSYGAKRTPVLRIFRAPLPSVRPLVGRSIEPCENRQSNYEKETKMRREGERGREAKKAAD